MKWVEMCMILADRLTKLCQDCKSSSTDLTNRRKKQKVIVYPFEETRASVWHRQANNEFSWERNQSEPRTLLTLTHFIPAKMSIVYLLLFAFTLKSWNISLFPDVPLCSSSSTRLWWTGDVGPGYLKEEKGKAAATMFPAPTFAKKTAGRYSVRSVSPPTDKKKHEETKTLSWGLWFIPPSMDFPCFQPLPVPGTTLPGLKV